MRAPDVSHHTVAPWSRRPTAAAPALPPRTPADTIDNAAVTEKPVWCAFQRAVRHHPRCLLPARQSSHLRIPRARADDYTNLHYRADGYLLTPNAPLATANLSSYWLENDLFIYQSLIGPGPLAVCVHLDLGFGMMTPTW